MSKIVETRKKEQQLKKNICVWREKIKVSTWNFIGETPVIVFFFHLKIIFPVMLCSWFGRGGVWVGDWGFCPSREFFTQLETSPSAGKRFYWLKILHFSSECDRGFFFGGGGLFLVLVFYLVIFCMFILRPEDPLLLPVMSIAASEWAESWKCWTWLY